MKRLKQQDNEAASQAGDDLLRVVAGLPSRAIHIGRDQFKSRVLLIQRNEFGRVVGSTEQFEEFEHTSVDGDFFE